jgi:hypothetical protein
MSIWNIRPGDWFRRYFPMVGRRRRGGEGEWFKDILRELMKHKKGYLTNSQRILKL